jgi:oligopeptide/dipeptide ABC transporter ATP-binding protein
VAALLSVHDLSVTFATGGAPARAVDGVSFDIDAGEVVGLVGESGCGKSVTALSLLRLLDVPPAAIGRGSRIMFDGTDILTMSEPALRRVRGARIAMVFQDPAASLNPVLTIGTQIGEVARAHRGASRAEARRRSIDLLGRVGIAEPERRVDAYPHELSGGMQQRVMIAMALAGEPQLLIADEPTTALDVTVQAQILALLRALQRETRMAMLLISHDLGVVARLARRILVMYGGQIVEEAPTEALFRRPLHPYTEGLLAAAPRADRPVKRLAAIPGSVPTAAEWPAGCRFHPRCRHRWERCEREAPELLGGPADGRTGGPANGMLDESTDRRTAGPPGGGEGSRRDRHARCWLLDEPDRRR